MAPNSTTVSTVTQQVTKKLLTEPDLNANIESEVDANGTLLKDRMPSEPEYKLQLVYKNVLKLGFLHICGIYGGLLFLFVVMWRTVFFTIIMAVFAGFGITAGAHRLWSHRSYKAKLPLRMLLGIFNCMAGQNDIYEWSRDHRVHHKYSETNADPHNVNRGFFFAHVGWLMAKKHPDVIQKGAAIDLSDLWADPVVKYQRLYYVPLVTLFGFIIPTLIPYYLWGETLWNAFFVCSMTRYCVTLNCTWLVNSAAHLWGNKPYDQYLSARENRFVTLGALGEGFHNYHHTFPYDYATSEFGWTMNMTTLFIDTMAALGQVYDRKSVSLEHVRHRMKRTGEMSGHSHHH